MGLDVSNITTNSTQLALDYVRNKIEEMQNRVIFLSLANNKLDRVPNTILTLISETLGFLSLAGNYFSTYPAVNSDDETGNFIITRNAILSVCNINVNI